ncbi:MAG: peptide chain release factor N(5)-glutamine methyltransferase [Kiritimatiellae bacterium]|jgi:release factor glutamine methyltransferase|nr:peptide chain release factor N(5)-glutamine methyltransferase [Kiritimatiellia bacterium]
MENPQTLKQCIELGAKYLERNKVENPYVVAELLAARLYSCGRMDLYQHAADKPQKRVLDAMRRGLQRVVAGEPIQYVLGQWDFHNLTLKVDKRALIPRPETEQLVDIVLKSSHLAGCEKPLVVDVGTGTGCIILSLAKALDKGVFVGIDISQDALSLAQENAALVGLEGRVHFAHGDGCGEFDPGSVDVLVSNPPYIPSKVVDGLEPKILEHEPRLALDGGADGLYIYRSLIFDAVMVVKPGGCIYFEIGDEQGSVITVLLEEFGFTDVEIKKDYAGKDRFAIAVQSA